MIFPRRCPVCDRPVKPFNALICKGCEEKPVRIGDRFCLKCGKSVRRGEGICSDCAKSRHAFDWGAAVFTYRSVSDSIYRFKYNGRQEYARYYGREMAGRLFQVLDLRGEEEPEALIPIPVSPGRRKQRGYNQAELMGRELSKETGIPLVADFLTRSESTSALKELSALERRKNLKMTFHAYGNGVNLRSVMLVDDIYTTGATMDACTRTLRAAGVRSISFITLAIGENDSGDGLC